jgi:hypothetical protein
MYTIHEHDTEHKRQQEEWTLHLLSFISELLKWARPAKDVPTAAHRSASRKQKKNDDKKANTEKTRRRRHLNSRKDVLIVAHVDSQPPRETGSASDEGHCKSSGQSP